MATYYYNAQVGSPSTNDGSSKTNAFATYAAAVAAASSDNDVILASHTSQEELSIDTTYTYLAHITVVAINFADDTVTPMGTGGWIGHSSLNRSVTFAGAKKVRHVGITPRTSGGTADSILIATTDGADQTWENCYLWNGNTVSTSAILFGTADVQAFVRLLNTTIRFGHVSQKLSVSATVFVDGGSVSSSGSAPTNLVLFQTNDPGGAEITFEGTDLSHCGSGNLVGDATTIGGEATFTNCKLGSGFVMLASQTVGNRSGARCYVFDSYSGDVNVNLGYADAMGSLIVDIGIYLTAGSAQASWKIVTTSNVSSQAPFITPWFDKYVAAGSVTPGIEILRIDGGTAPDDLVWGEWSYKGTSGFPISTFTNDRRAVLGTPAEQAAGAGAAAWTNAGSPAGSWRLSPGALTVAENGYLRSRISIATQGTFYANPGV